MRENKTTLPEKHRLSKPYSKGNKETLAQLLDKRNSRLLHLFRDTQHKVTLIGPAERPEIILDDKIKISAYAHNFDLNFVEKEKVIFKVKINASNNIPEKFLKVFLNTVEQAPAKKKRKRIIIPKIEKVEPRRRMAS